MTHDHALTRVLAGQTALVTGATRANGIGAAVVRRLAASGCDVAFSHWRPYDAAFPWGASNDDPERLESEARESGVRALAIECDLAEEDGVIRLLDAVEQGIGPVGVLINNAAHSTSDGYRALDATTLDAHYVVNMRATMLLAAEFCRRFPRSGRLEGRIVNMTSGQGLGPMPDELAYGATKGAIEAFTRSLAPAVMPLGITVNAVNPGPTDTGWISDDLRTTLLPMFPSGRLGMPDDAARLIAWLAGPDAGWVTGQIISSEGGFMRG